MVQANLSYNLNSQIRKVRLNVIGLLIAEKYNMVQMINY